MLASLVAATHAETTARTTNWLMRPPPSAQQGRPGSITAALNGDAQTVLRTLEVLRPTADPAQSDRQRLAVQTGASPCTLRAVTARDAPVSGGSIERRQLEDLVEELLHGIRPCG